MEGETDSEDVPSGQAQRAVVACDNIQSSCCSGVEDRQS